MILELTDKQSTLLLSVVMDSLDNAQDDDLEELGKIIGKLTQ